MPRPAVDRSALLHLLHQLDGHLGLAVYRGEGDTKPWIDEARGLIIAVRSHIEYIEKYQGDYEPGDAA